MVGFTRDEAFKAQGMYKKASGFNRLRLLDKGSGFRHPVDRATALSASMST